LDSLSERADEGYLTRPQVRYTMRRFKLYSLHTCIESRWLRPVVLVPAENHSQIKC